LNRCRERIRIDEADSPVTSLREDFSSTVATCFRHPPLPFPLSRDGHERISTGLHLLAPPKRNFSIFSHTPNCSGAIFHPIVLMVILISFLLFYLQYWSSFFSPYAEYSSFPSEPISSGETRVFSPFHSPSPFFFVYPSELVMSQCFRDLFFP